MAQNYIRLKWSVDTKRLDRKMTKLILGFKDAGAFSLKEIGELGKTKARLLAPKLSGRTFQGITLMKNDGREVRIVAKNPTASDGHKRGNGSTRYFTRGKFNLVKWMHTSPRAVYHIKTGDHLFMYSTADYLRRVAPQIVESEFNKIIVRNN